MLRVERAQRAVLKVMSNKPIYFPTADLYALSNVLSVRKLFVLQTVLRKHSELPYNSSILCTKRRSHAICQINSARTAAAKRHYPYLSCLLYNRINKLLNIYPLTSYRCKSECLAWLQSITYEETEELLTNVY